MRSHCTDLSRLSLAGILGVMLSCSLYAAQLPPRAIDSVEQAIDNPEYLLKHWITLPSATQTPNTRIHHLSLEDAILLALRYNPNVQHAALDRIVQRYQLRLAQNAFEMQYALIGTANVTRNQFGGVGSDVTHSYLATPELLLHTRQGTQMGLTINNNVSPYNSFTPVLQFSVTQPLLRGGGRKVNEIPLLNAQDAETFNKANLKQLVMDEITGVIDAYHALILSAQQLENQSHQLKEAETSYDLNEKRIASGHLESTGNVQQAYQVESLKLQVEQAQQDLEIRTGELLQRLGLSPSLKLAVPSDTSLKPQTIPTIPAAINTVLKNNRDYIGSLIALRAAERAYTLAKNQQSWQLDAGVNVQTGVLTDVEGQRNGLKGLYQGRNTSEAANLYFSMPFHDLSRRNLIIQAKVTLEQTRLRHTALKRALIQQTTQIIHLIHSQMRRYMLAQKQVSLAMNAYRLEKEKQSAGISTSLDISYTQNQLLNAQASLIGAKIAYLNDISRLQQLLGTTLDVWHIRWR